MADRLSLLAEYHKVAVKDAMYLDGGRSYKEKELNQEISQRFLLGTEGFTYRRTPMSHEHPEESLQE